jgi:hypothetical protein
MDYTLKFQSEAAANGVLFTDQTQVMGDVVETVKVSNFPQHSVDIIGIIYKPTGKLLTSEEGDYPEMAPVPGWHANVRGPEAATLAEYHINVNTPVRGWA